MKRIVCLLMVLLTALEGSTCRLPENLPEVEATQTVGLINDMYFDPYLVDVAKNNVLDAIKGISNDKRYRKSRFC